MLLLFLGLFLFCFLWRCGPTRAMASSFLRFLDHTRRRITVGRTPLDEWSARRRDLYLTTHNTHNRQISMPPVGFEPHGLSRRAVVDLRLRPRGYWDRLVPWISWKSNPVDPIMEHSQPMPCTILVTDRTHLSCRGIMEFTALPGGQALCCRLQLMTAIIYISWVCTDRLQSPAVWTNSSLYPCHGGTSLMQFTVGSNTSPHLTHFLHEKIDITTLQIRFLSSWLSLKSFLILDIPTVT